MDVPWTPPAPSLSRILDVLSDIVVFLDENWVIREVNAAATRILGGHGRLAIGSSALDLLHPDDLNGAASGLMSLLHSPDQANRDPIQLRVVGSDGEWRHFEVSPTNLLGDPDVRRVVLVLRDVSERVGLTEQLQNRIHHDHLTGLLNRGGIIAAIAAALRTCGPERTMAVAMCDLDGFKDVNDTFGHAAGDAVLEVIATRLANGIRPTDSVGRLGGDEFVIVFSSLPSADELESIVRRLQRQVGGMVHVGDRQLLVPLSIGTVVPSAEEVTAGLIDPAALLAAADAAMYEVKRSRQRAHRMATDQPISAPVPVDESRRLALVKSVQRVGLQGVDPVLAAVADLVAQACDVPMAAVTLIDATDQYLVATFGMGTTNDANSSRHARNDSFCAFALEGDGPLVVPDVHADARFAGHTSMIGSPGVAAYAGMPVRLGEGSAVGTVCALDTAVRMFSTDQLEALRAAAMIVASHLRSMQTSTAAPGTVRQ